VVECLSSGGGGVVWWLSIEKGWVMDPLNELVGRTVKSVRPLDKDDLFQFGWDEYPGMEGDAVVVELDDGSLLVPSCDAELNGGGHLVHAVPFVDHPEDLQLFGIFFVRGS